jgi:hypothetical protein
MYAIINNAGVYGCTQECVFGFICGCVRERRERESVEAMEMQHVKGKLSMQTTPREEGPHASKESKRGGWITFPFITGFSLSLSLGAVT